VNPVLEPLALWRVVTPMVVVTVAALFCLWRPMPLLRIVMLCIGGAIAYGVLQDQVSARLCPEYFTIAHRPVAGLSDPTLLGMTWGFLGSWWGGLVIGLAVAVAATTGSRPRVKAHELIKPMIVLAAGVALVTLLFGAGGYYFARVNGVALGYPWASLIPPERHLRFIAVTCAHFATYAGAVIAGIVLCIWTVRQRRQ
jgi:hypothetical protein